MAQSDTEAEPPLNPTQAQVGAGDSLAHAESQLVSESGSSSESASGSSESESESESDSSIILKPVFVKSSRRTINPRNQTDKKSIQTDKLKFDNIVSTVDAQETLIDDTDDIDPEKEFNDWKMRELRRYNDYQMDMHNREQEQMHAVPELLDHDVLETKSSIPLKRDSSHINDNDI